MHFLREVQLCLRRRHRRRQATRSGVTLGKLSLILTTCASPNDSSSTSVFLTSKTEHVGSLLKLPLEAVALGWNRSPSLEKVTSIPSAWGRDRKRENLTQQSASPDSGALLGQHRACVATGVCGEVVFGLHSPV